MSIEELRMASAIEGVKVLEIAELVTGPFCGKLLADFGADVIKIEKPGAGDKARRYGPFPNNIPHPERSLLFFYLNSNKRGVTLDIKSRLGKEVLSQMVAQADVLLIDRPPVEVQELELTNEALRGLNPRLIVTLITPFGATGSYSGFKAYPLNVYHSGGEGYLLPGGPEWLLDLSRPPVKPARFGGEYECGLNACIATLGALFGRSVSDTGQSIDISKQESLLQLSAVEIAKYPNENFIETRATRAYSVGGITQCKDGYVEIMPLEEHMWPPLVELMSNPEWAKDERFKNRETRAKHGEELNALILEWACQHTKEEIYHSCQAKGVPAGVVRTAEDLVLSKQIQSRGFIVDVSHPELGELKMPSSPTRFSLTPWQYRRPAPLLGEDNEAVYINWLGYTKEDLVWMRQFGVI